jgi:hypothetical protein
MDKVKEIDVNRFSALVVESRKPQAAYISEELAWYANEEETVLGVLLLDLIDNDYAAVIFKRDEGERFRAITAKASFSNASEATAWIERNILWHSSFSERI